MCIDAHIHLSLDGKGAHRRSKEELLRHIVRTFEEYKKRDIYILRDGGDNLELAPMARDIAGKVGLVYKTPIHSFYKKGHYGSFTGKPVGNIRDFNDEFVRWMAKKPDHLKIILTGIVNFDVYGEVGDVAFTFEELYYMIQSAKDKGLPAMVHANSPRGVQWAIKAGADTVEHGYFIADEELYMMAERDVTWVPTLSPLGNLIRDGNPRFKAQRLNIKRTYDAQRANVEKAYKIGVRIAVGSDAGAYGVYHGQGFYDEIEHLEKAGIKKEGAFEMALDNGIKALDLSSREMAVLLKKVSANELSLR